MKINFFTILFFFCPFVLLSQHKTDKETQDYIDGKYVQLSNAIKFDPVRMIIGDISFSYERVVGQKASLELEIGPTISNTGLNRLNFNFIDDDDINGFSVGNESALGILGSLAFRYYVLNGRPAMNQLYISPKYKFRQYNEMNNASGYNLESIKGGIQQHIFTFNIGMQFWVSKSFSLDCYVGFGLTSNHRTRYAVVENYTGSEYVYDWYKYTKNSVNPTISTGLKLGLGF